MSEGVKVESPENESLLNDSKTNDANASDLASPDGDDRPHSPQFEPIVSLPDEIKIEPLEKDEDELFKMRAKLFRFDNMVEPQEWKERGVGDIKILKHKSKNTHRVLMRRDKTMKVCTNHKVQPWMKLEVHGDSERTWMWSVQADLVDDKVEPQVLAVRFATVEGAKQFKEVFDSCCAGDDNFNTSLGGDLNTTDKDGSLNETSDLEKKLEEVSLQESKSKEDPKE